MKNLIDYNKWAINTQVNNRIENGENPFSEEVMKFIDGKVATDKDQHMRAASHSVQTVKKELEGRGSKDNTIRLAAGLLGKTYQMIRSGERDAAIAAYANIECVRNMLNSLEKSEDWCDGHLSSSQSSISRFLMDDSEIKQEYVDAANEFLEKVKVAQAS